MRPEIPVSRPLRVLALLEVLSGSSVPLTLTQLADRLGQPKTSVSRLLNDLEALSYVIRAPGSRGFVTGSRAHALGLAVVQGPSLLTACRSVLARLVEVTGETCNLNILVGDSVQYLVRVESPGDLRLQLRMDSGSRVPLHCTASGKLFLAYMPQPQYGQVLNRLRLVAMAPRTLTRRSELESALRAVREQDLAIDDEEFICGMVALAVPVRNAQGHMIAALACHAPTAQVSLKELMRHSTPMRHAADELSAILSQG